MEVAWCSDHGMPHSALLEWSPEDRAKLTAHLIESAQKCTMCGTSPWEWEEDRHAYEGAVDQCWGCYIKDRAGQGEDLMPGASVVLIPKRVAEARREQMLETGDL